jgi:hypothetical protein
MAYDVAGKLVEIKITQDFIDQRDERSKKYNARGRSEVQLRLDIECEVFEWYMISIKNLEGRFKMGDRWQLSCVWRRRC